MKIRDLRLAVSILRRLREEVRRGKGREGEAGRRAEERSEEAQRSAKCVGCKILIEDHINTFLIKILKYDTPEKHWS